MSYDDKPCVNFHDDSIELDWNIGYNRVSYYYLLFMSIIAICLNIWIIFTYVRMSIQIRNSKKVY